ncbi:alpha/beta hydrolase [Paractinoplanes deccanensis]|uniref:Alpha/beta hydrolase n=1 Tax=Paractinoplanes deccanensis TaxID=113561 RepID=A0ABQ3YF29_9ACTN|nr:alpha/beta hydrolase [Actinoplanes deccanensis]GID78596.1 alpha/beta hydrolase [Actinoplanes deccanensis]
MPDEPLKTYSIEVNGIAQRFHVAGEGPICVMHSGGPGIDWSYLRMPLVEEYLTAVYVEPVGTGESGRLPAHPHGYGIDAYVPFLDAVVEHVGASYVLGHSHGGFVAQKYALSRPDRLTGLILYGTAPCTGPDFEALAQRNAERQRERLAHRPSMAEVLAALDADWPSTDAGATARIRATLPLYFADYWGAEERFEPFRDAFRSWKVFGDGTDFDVRDRLGEITAPTLAVAGTYDWICDPSWSREIAAGIPGGQYAEQTASGHFGHVEEPEGFAEIIAKFIGA